MLNNDTQLRLKAELDSAYQAAAIAGHNAALKWAETVDLDYINTVASVQFSDDSVWLLQDEVFDDTPAGRVFNELMPKGLLYRGHMLGETIGLLGDAWVSAFVDCTTAILASLKN